MSVGSASDGRRPGRKIGAGTAAFHIFVKNKPITPMAVATDYGDVVILKDAVDDFRAEEITRAIAVVSNSMVGVADHPMKGKDYKESIIPGAISYAMKIGDTQRGT